jgi:hypothetical protein
VQPEGLLVDQYANGCVVLRKPHASHDTRILTTEIEPVTVTTEIEAV